MAYSAFNSTEVSTGEPVKTELFQKVKDNFDDHESRITVVEAAVASFLPIEFCVKGPYAKFGVQTAVLKERITFDLNLLAARLMIDFAGSVGTTEVDVLYKRGVGAFTSIFSTRPSIIYTAGDNAISTNGILSTTALLAGDVLRMDITSVQTLGSGFNLYLEYER